MNEFVTTRRAALLSLGALAAFGALPATGATPPGDSVYRLAATLTDQDGRAFELASLQGTPVLASMFYSSCDMVCPMIFETVHATLAALPAAERAELRVLMVSFDPARDTTAVLKKTAQARNCDAQWLLARADEATARKVAAVLGVQYRRLANGEFNHSTTLALLDRQGRIAARSGKLGPAHPALVSAARKVVATAA
ncbi:SCO family protein [Ramlibacter ginsenosidimutans]|uniref:SCO family protein n=1 Tax=Ramlibacter ginsenosidimutans TaxID=502333 RepID=A0A934WKV7_9BURK|nr:SCO family protein [Ramlibacter ginsenosidimutans]MBK6006109.1 SCO family protein [Ramlibacter ginsenosidimutans]